MAAIEQTRQTRKKLGQAASVAGKAVASAWELVCCAVRHRVGISTILRQELLRAAVIAGGPADVAALGEIAKKHPRLIKARFPRPRGGMAKDKDAQWAVGRTPLMLAVARGNQECADLLIPLSDLEAQDAFERTALTLATSAEFKDKTSRLKMMEALLAAGANGNHTTKDGFTALMVVAQSGFVELVERLLKCAGASVDAKHAGRSALSEAMIAGAREAVAALLRVSSQLGRDEACLALLAALASGWLPGAPVMVGGMRFAGRSQPALESQRALWWRMIDLGDGFWSAETMFAAFELAGKSAQEKLPRAWARQEAAILRTEIGLDEGPETARMGIPEHVSKKAAGAHAPGIPCRVLRI